MYRTRLCLNLNRQLNMPEADQIRLFRQVGFEGFFSGWHAGMDMAALRKTADEEGMLYQSVHAPQHRILDMWKPSDRTETAVSELIACLRDCADNGVELVVMHAFIGFQDFPPMDFGLESYSRVVREAERLGIKIALENTEGDEYLAALMAHFRGCSAVGFCWDSGHELCYNQGHDMLALYGDRLLGTHLNDNLGVRDFGGSIFWHDDLHLLPFDGIADWQDVAVRLHRCRFAGPLTFELKIESKPGRHENDPYGRMAPEEYLTAAYMRACRAAALLQRQ